MKFCNFITENKTTKELFRIEKEYTVIVFLKSNRSQETNFWSFCKDWCINSGIEEN